MYNTRQIAKKTVDYYITKSQTSIEDNIKLDVTTINNNTVPIKQLMIAPMVRRVIAYQKVTSDLFEYSRTDSEYCANSDTEMTCTKIIKQQITIVGTNEINGNNCNYGGLCSIYVKTKNNDNVYNKKFKNLRTFMIKCEIDEYSHKLHEVSQTIFYH